MLTQFRLFRLDSTDGSSEVLNRFLREHRITQLERQFVAGGPESFYSVLVEYEVGATDPRYEKKGRVDYPQALQGEHLSRYQRLCEWRAKQAREDGVPVYAILNNSQAEQASALESPSLVALEKIPGIGKGRLQRYGKAILEQLRTEVTADA